MLPGTLLVMGIVCVIAAIVGGGSKAAGVHIPVIDSVLRQVMLALFGFAVMAGGIVLRDSERPSPEATRAVEHQQLRATWDHRFPARYVGAVWVRVMPARAREGAAHRVTINWGPNVRRVRLRRLGPAPRSLIFEKGDDDVPLHVTVRPPATITFGTKRPPDRNASRIDGGWRRSA